MTFRIVRVSTLSAVCLIAGVAVALPAAASAGQWLLAQSVNAPGEPKDVTGGQIPQPGDAESSEWRPPIIPPLKDCANASLPGQGQAGFQDFHRPGDNIPGGGAGPGGPTPGPGDAQSSEWRPPIIPPKGDGSAVAQTSDCGTSGQAAGNYAPGTNLGPGVKNPVPVAPEPSPEN